MSIARGKIFESRADLETAEYAMYRAKYTDGPPWDPVTGPRERGIVTGRALPADSRGRNYTEFDFGPVLSVAENEHFNYPDEFVEEMIQKEHWAWLGEPIEGNREDTDGFLLLPTRHILWNRAMTTTTTEIADEGGTSRFFVREKTGRDAEVVNWEKLSTHLSYFSYHIAAYWRNPQKDERALQALFPKILWDAFKGEASAGLSQPFDSSLNDVVTDSIYPASFAGHLSKVQGMPKCYNLPSETKRWKRKRLLLPEGGEATLADWADDEQGQESGDDEQEPGWRCFPDRDAITLEPPGRTSLFSVMGVRVHTRLMAIALVQMCNGRGDLGPGFEMAHNFETLQRDHGVEAVKATGGEEAEEALNNSLARCEASWDHPGGIENTLSLGSLALALQGPRPGDVQERDDGDDMVDLESAEGKFVDKLVQLYQPSRILKPRRVRMGASPDGWLVQQSAHNAWSAVCALTSSSKKPLCAIAVEKRVVWSFGLHTAKGGWQLQGAVVANRMKQGLIWCVQQLTVVTRM